MELNSLVGTKLSATLLVDMKTAGATVIYTVPAGKTLYIRSVLITDTSASLAGGTSYSITNFRQAFDLSSMTTLGTDYMEIKAADLTKYTRLAAGTTVSWTVTTGSTAPCTATITLFGILL